MALMELRTVLINIVISFAVFGLQVAAKGQWWAAGREIAQALHQGRPIYCVSRNIAGYLQLHNTLIFN
jgi:hypothetical protein